MAVVPFNPVPFVAIAGQHARGTCDEACLNFGGYLFAGVLGLCAFLLILIVAGLLLDSCAP